MNETDIGKAINQVVDDTKDYRKTLGEKQAENKNTAPEIVSAIDSHTVSLRNGIAVNEQLPISNCVREIKSRLRKLSTLDPNLAQQKETALKQEFPKQFS